MTTLYIAGPMTHLPDYNRHNFNAAERRLRAAGYDVLNPARTDLGPDATWAGYMDLAIRQVLDADGIALLPGWERSRGANLEVHIAEQLGKRWTSVWQWLRETGNDDAIYPLGTIGGEG